jgi:hypothetical protein
MTGSPGFIPMCPHYPAVRVPSWSSWLVALVPFGRQIGISRWMPAGAGAFCRERLIRLKPGLLNGDIGN